MDEYGVTVVFKGLLGFVDQADPALNVAETGKGLYGVEAAAEKYFHCHASKLTRDQAICIARVLPNPLVRNPQTAAQRHRTKYNNVSKTMKYVSYPFTP